MRFLLNTEEKYLLKLVGKILRFTENPQNP